ncbi:MAG: SHOCT domain-containing protein [Actinobacteria bacterium]|nr:SHOCT domain-containing protein [Actinomycetota bacterium]
MPNDRMGDMMDGMMAWGWLGALVGLLILLLIIAVLAAGFIYLVRALRQPHAGGGDAPDPPGRSRPAREILDERYARGEIDQDDYEQRRRLLGN